MLRYLARYTHRVAISNRRLVALDDKGVTGVPLIAEDLPQRPSRQYRAKNGSGGNRTNRH